MTGILESTVYLSVTALLILLFKWIFKNKLSAKWHVLIWALLALRLVLPSLPESSLSIFNAIDLPNEQVAAETELYEESDAIILQEPITVNPEQPSEIKAQPVDKQTVIVAVVAAGAVLVFLYFVSVYFVCIRKNGKKPRAADKETLSLVEECKKKVGVKRRVYIVTEGESPMLMGLIKPTIILPDGYSQSEKKDIIIHELCHLKGGDIYLLWLAMIVLCLNWYNPIMWICFFMFRRDIEVYCDERVLRYIDSKKDYASLLVKTALKKNSFIAGTTSLQNGEKEVERRVKYMAYFKKPHYTWTVIIVIIAVIIGVVCLTDPKSSGDDAKEQEDEVLQKADAEEVENEVAETEIQEAEKAEISTEYETPQQQIEQESLPLTVSEIVDDTTEISEHETVTETGETVEDAEMSVQPEQVPEPVKAPELVKESEPVPEVIPIVIENTDEPVMLTVPETVEMEADMDFFDTAQPETKKEKSADEQTEPEPAMLENEISISSSFMW